MTIDERVQAVADLGFTERQARFLVLVMRHAGVCVPRQYASFAGIANGGKICNAFFDKLVRRRYAAASHCVHNRARLYYVHHKALYCAIGGASSRYRRPVPARQASERLMLLDAVLTTPDLEWLTTGSEKGAYLASLAASAPADTPRAAPAGPVSGKVSELPGTLPIGVDAAGRTVLIYLGTEPWTERFRSFLQAHTTLLRAARTWTIRLVFPRPLDRFYDAYQTGIRDELESPLHPATVSELKWFFEHRPKAGHDPVHPADAGIPRRRREGLQHDAILTAVSALAAARRRRIRWPRLARYSGGPERWKRHGRDRRPPARLSSSLPLGGRRSRSTGEG